MKHPAVIAGIAELDDCIHRKLGDKVKDKEIDPLLTSLVPDVADDDPFDDAANLNDLKIVPAEPIDPNTIPDEHQSPGAFDAMENKSQDWLSGRYPQFYPYSRYEGI
jgi:hypothetical protein